MPAAFTILPDRGVLAVDGSDARSLLQRLLTNDVEHLASGEARYAALLTPQGKVITDMLVVAGAAAETLLIDAPAATAADLCKRLTLYKLRAKVTVTDRSATLAVVTGPATSAAWPPGLAFADPRDPGLWPRAIVERSACPPEAFDPSLLAAYAASRIRAGVPEGGADYPFGDTFPHEANLDHLAGVNFKKGCYVGQEVVSRVEHRGTARKRIVGVRFAGEAPPPGTELLAGDVPVGTMGTAAEGRGLATIRLDRVAETAAPLSGAGIPLELVLPAWAGAVSQAANRA